MICLKLFVCSMCLVAMIAAVASAAAVETVNTPKVLPDRSIDTSSVAGIIQGVCKNGMKPQEKFLALYQFYRRMIYHGRYMGPDRRSLLRMIPPLSSVSQVSIRPR